MLVLKDEGDHDVAVRLVDTADVLIDPFRPGVTERLGLGPDTCRARNPRLVHARMTDWGQDGPLADRAGHDINYLAVSGVLGLLGTDDEPPLVPLNLVADFGGGGMLLGLGVLAAPLERERSGLGQTVDVSMVDGVMQLAASIIQMRSDGHWNTGRGTNFLQGADPWYRAYRTSDGEYITVGALEPRSTPCCSSRSGWTRQRTTSGTATDGRPSPASSRTSSPGTPERTGRTCSETPTFASHRSCAGTSS